MKNRPGLWLIIVGSCMLVVVTLMIAVPRLQAFWQQPLGPSLGFEDTPTPDPLAVLPTDTTVVEPTGAQVIVLDNNPTPTLPLPNATPTAIVLPTDTPNPVCGDVQQMIVLAIGIDYRPGTYTYGLADVIRLVVVDFAEPRVAVLAFPRDLWVEVPGISSHYGITHSKLNQSYFYGTPAMGYYDGPGGGAGLLARTIDQNFGVQAEHYGVVNMNVLIEMIDAMGGVDIYLYEGIDARDNPESEDEWKIYPAGWNHLNGKRAVYYARIRHLDSVFGRMDRQTEILCAIKNKLLSPSTVMGIPDMITAFIDNVLTDLSPEQLSQFACLAPQLSGENIVFARFPEDELTGKSIKNPNTNGNEFVWDADYNQLRTYVSEFMAGTWPPAPDQTEPDDTHAGETQMLCPVYPDR